MSVSKVNVTQLQESIQYRGRYTKLPWELWDQPIGPKAKLLYLFLISQKKGANTTYEFIDFHLKMDDRTIKKALGELEANGMIVIQSDGKCNNYLMLGVDQWSKEESPAESPASAGEHITRKRGQNHPQARAESPASAGDAIVYNKSSKNDKKETTATTTSVSKPTGKSDPTVGHNDLPAGGQSKEWTEWIFGKKQRGEPLSPLEQFYDNTYPFFPPATSEWKKTMEPVLQSIAERYSTKDIKISTKKYLQACDYVAPFTDFVFGGSTASQSDWVNCGHRVLKAWELKEDRDPKMLWLRSQLFAIVSKRAPKPFYMKDESNEEWRMKLLNEFNSFINGQFDAETAEREAHRLAEEDET